MNVLISDDHPLIRKGMKQILADSYEELTIGEAGTVRETLDALEQTAWDALILDISMPDGSGIDVLRHLRIKGDPLPVLVLSLYSEEEMGAEAVRAGANGFMTKEMAPDELVVALNKILKGQQHVSAAIAKMLERHRDEDERRE